MKSCDLRPLKEFLHKDNKIERLVLMNVDYTKESVTVFYKESHKVEFRTFDWCMENLVLLDEFNNK